MTLKAITKDIVTRNAVEHMHATKVLPIFSTALTPLTVIMILSSFYAPKGLSPKGITAKPNIVGKTKLSQ